MEDSCTFAPEDQPESLAELVGSFTESVSNPAACGSGYIGGRLSSMFPDHVRASRQAPASIGAGRDAPG